MIMDEPTASLDALAEEKIYKEMNEIMQGKTSILFPTELQVQGSRQGSATGRRSIRQSGTNEELMAEGGLYRDV